VAYDLFGNGKTALKFNLGHYLDAATNDSEYTSNSPQARIVRTVNRNWDDSNNNKVIDCNIMNFAANDECAALTGNDLNFGKPNPTTTVNPDTLTGWGVRQNDWQWGVNVQQEIMPRVSIEVGYNRRWFHGEKVTDNTLRGPGDYEQFTIMAPQDPRLPGGGGYPITLGMVTPAAAARGALNLVTFETDFGPERTNYWHGLDYSFSARLRQGLTFQAGAQTGRSVLDICGAAAVMDQNSTAQLPVGLGNNGVTKDLRNCRDADPFQTSFRGLTSYTVPKIDVLVSATLRTQPELERTATWQVPNTVIQSIIGRLPPGGNANGNTNIEILDADHRLFAGNRRTQIDMRFAKVLRFGARRANIGVDLGNLLNTNYTTTYEDIYQFSAGNTGRGGTWNNPTAVVTPRFVRWNLTVDY
jgi:hypothetical protein